MRLTDIEVPEFAGTHLDTSPGKSELDLGPGGDRDVQSNFFLLEGETEVAVFQDARPRAKSQQPGRMKLAFQDTEQLCKRRTALEIRGGGPLGATGM
jgi:hypothetical protein